ncbi:MAG: DNA repair protein RecN [uncultured Solirubrobacteraceae bacterium]|uniref:DNA repair protein RecN n=1 Tax=uncultured Solirubrobacteraceae bacterium TaxID=1162706 RepID=A0A6J4T7E1_9ACTN|nr:MAG: DNA repair protein RecN [uncultured Solirubrobacteraceae bacterium]
MLQELRVENLLLIERAELRLRPGLNVITGETGAGKTMLAHALDLLLGGKARSGIVRPGASEAYVEGVFDLPDGLRGELGERLPEGAEEVVLARRVSASGRTRALLCGRTVPAEDLREVAASLVAFYGQHEHRKLTVASAQLELLDGFCGPKHLEARTAFAAVHAEVRRLEGSLVELRERAGARDRELDLLEFELAEIEAAAPSEAEEASLLAERGRVRHLEALRSAAFVAAGALDGEGGAGFSGGEEFGGGSGSGGGGLAGELAAGERELWSVAGVDAALDPLTERFRALVLEADDLAGELRRYGSGLEGEPGRLEVVEERLAAIDRLKRKHGGSVEAVLAHAEKCRTRRDELVNAEVALEEATAAIDRARANREVRAKELRATRAKAAPKLAAGVRDRLAELAMEGASFEIALSEREPAPSGADSAEFLIAPNPGVPAAPLREVGSGGELSRVMLALLGTANDGSDATLVFDEVDAGIGGQTARAVGEQLRSLGEGRQVLCITHLPQIASLAAQHFSIAKDTGVEPARTTVTELADRDVVAELVRMLGADSGDLTARRHAQELRKVAA